MVSQNKQSPTGPIAIGLGLVVFSLGLTLDVIGIGATEGFGMIQIAMVVVGATAVVVGIVLARRSR